MNDDALAAVIAAAQLYLRSANDAAADALPPGSGWAIASRLRARRAAGAPKLARARSRWSAIGRLE